MIPTEPRLWSPRLAPALIALALLGPGAAQADGIPTLEELVRAADLVVVGRVIRTDVKDVGPFATVAVESSWKGPIAPGEMVRYLTGNRLPGDVSAATKGEYGLFFLELARRHSRYGGTSNVELGTPTAGDWYCLGGLGRGHFPIQARSRETLVRNLYGIQSASNPVPPPSTGRRKKRAPAPTGLRTLPEYQAVVRGTMTGDYSPVVTAGGEVGYVQAFWADLRKSPLMNRDQAPRPVSTRGSRSGH